MTVEAGPPVETQVRVNTGGSAVTADVRLNSSGSVTDVTAPEGYMNMTSNAKGSIRNT